MMRTWVDNKFHKTCEHSGDARPRGVRLWRSWKFHGTITNDTFFPVETTEPPSIQRSNAHWTMNLPPRDDKWSTHLRFQVRRVPTQTASLKTPSELTLQTRACIRGKDRTGSSRERQWTLYRRSITKAYCTWNRPVKLKPLVPSSTTTFDYCSSKTFERHHGKKGRRRAI